MCYVCCASDAALSASLIYFITNAKDEESESRASMVSTSHHQTEIKRPVSIYQTRQSTLCEMFDDSPTLESGVHPSGDALQISRIALQKEAHVGQEEGAANWRKLDEDRNVASKPATSMAV